jgi:hypothetical protein
MPLSRKALEEDVWTATLYCQRTMFLGSTMIDNRISGIKIYNDVVSSLSNEVNYSWDCLLDLDLDTDPTREFQQHASPRQWKCGQHLHSHSSAPNVGD